MALADEEGLQVLSMRKLAQRLDLTPMALYGYFPDKNALLDAVVEQLLSEPELPEEEPDWRETLRWVGRGARELARQHPGTFPLLFARPVVTPRGSELVERIRSAIAAAGVPSD